MKKTAFLLLLAATVFSCKDDKEEGNKYDFKDQELSGQIADENWIYDDGYAEVDGNNRLRINLMDAHEGLTGCEAEWAQTDMVFFSCPNAVGLYELDFEGTGSGQTVTLFDYAEVFNYISNEGAVEILSITETSVTGRIDARGDDDFFVNGNFTIDRCGN
jgi:hypothetical protein